MHPYLWSSLNCRSFIVPFSKTIGPECYYLFVLITSLHSCTFRSCICFHLFGFEGHASVQVRFSASFRLLFGLILLAINLIRKVQKRYSLYFVSPSIFIYVFFGGQSQGSHMLLCHVWRLSKCCLTLLTYRSCWSFCQPYSWNQFPFSVPSP